MADRLRETRTIIVSDDRLQVEIVGLAAVTDSPLPPAADEAPSQLIELPHPDSYLLPQAAAAIADLPVRYQTAIEAPAPAPPPALTGLAQVMRTTETRTSLRYVLVRPGPEHNQRETDGNPMVTVLALLAGLLADHPTQIASCEIHARSDATTLLIAVPETWQTALTHHLYASYPTAFVEPHPELATIDRSGELGGVTVSFSPSEKPLNQPVDTTVDLLRPLFEMCGSLAGDETVAIQLVLGPVEPQRSFVKKVAEQAVMTGKEQFRQFFFGRTADQAAETTTSNKDETAAFRANLRILIQAPTTARVAALRTQASAAFAQFAQPGETKLVLKIPRRLKSWLKDFAGRHLRLADALLLTTDEAAQLFHVPGDAEGFGKLLTLKTRQLPPPVFPVVPGLTLGLSRYRDQLQPVTLAAEDRLRHLYLIGQTGTGKSTLFQSWMVDDMLAGAGCAFIDPHGEAVDWLLERIPKERIGDVLLFDPAADEGQLGLNLLEWETPTERDLLIQELISLFYKLFDPDRTGIIGPQFEHWLRCAALTITEPAVRGTLVDIPRLFTDHAFQRAVVARAEHPAVKAFWLEQMAQTAPFHKSEMLNYFTSKFGSFLGNQTMRNLLGQTQSAFRLRTLMDQRKILLVNLSKGRLGEQNAQLIGTLLMAKLTMAALSRADQPRADRLPFYVYIDEFHSIATDSFASLLSEVRKYGVGLHLTHQYASQLSPALREAIVGNVGTLLACRVGQDDAGWLAGSFAPLIARDLTNIAAFHFHARTLLAGGVTNPFLVRSRIVDRLPQSAIQALIRRRMAAYSTALHDRRTDQDPRGLLSL